MRGRQRAGGTARRRGSTSLGLLPWWSTWQQPRIAHHRAGFMTAAGSSLTRVDAVSTLFKVFEGARGYRLAQRQLGLLGVLRVLGSPADSPEEVRIVIRTDHPLSRGRLLGTHHPPADI